MTVSPNTAKTAIHKASSQAQSAIEKTEAAAIAAVDRAEGAFESLKAGFEGAKDFGTGLYHVADNAGRTAIGGAVALNGSIANYNRDAVSDMIEVGRKTFEAKSVSEVVQLHTAFTERRINAFFQTVGATNSLAQTSIMAMWSPLASMLRDAPSAQTTQAEPVQKTNKGKLKTAA